MIKSVIVLNF